MKANLALPRGGFDNFAHPLSHQLDFHAFTARATAVARLASAYLSKALHWASREENYLNQAQDHADLERRLRELERNSNNFANWSR